MEIVMPIDVDLPAGTPPGWYWLPSRPAERAYWDGTSWQTTEPALDMPPPLGSPVIPGSTAQRPARSRAAVMVMAAMGVVIVALLAVVALVLTGDDEPTVAAPSASDGASEAEPLTNSQAGHQILIDLDMLGEIDVDQEQLGEAAATYCADLARSSRADARADLEEGIADAMMQVVGSDQLAMERRKSDLSAGFMVEPVADAAEELLCPGAGTGGFTQDP